MAAHVQGQAFVVSVLWLVRLVLNCRLEFLQCIFVILRQQVVHSKVEVTRWVIIFNFAGLEKILYRACYIAILAVAETPLRVGLVLLGRL